MGSAYGGQWQPKNEDDEQLLGEPGERKTSGYKETEIGDDGRANYQTHNTDHGNSKAHSNPHGHEIAWGPNGQPIFGPQINDFGGKNFNYLEKGVLNMEWTAEYLYSIATTEKLKQNSFKTISDFKWCMKFGGEVGFAYNKRLFGVSHYEGKVIVYETNKSDAISYYDTPDEALEYIIDGKRLRDIITEVEVFDRTV